MSRRPPLQVPPLVPTARPNHPTLTVRTSMYPSTYSTPRPQALSTSPPGRTSTSPEGVPKAIHPDKVEKALQLYIEYRRELYKEQLLKREPQSATRIHDGYHLRVPGTPTPRSVTSHTSSRRHRATSVSTSAYEGGTDRSSVMSFDGNESPSANVRVKTEAIAYDGKTIVKQRTRRKLDPVAKAKAALIRWLESCKTCNRRRVKCPLEHHDISILVRRLEESRRRNDLQHPYPISPSNGNSPRNDATTPTGNAMAGISQGDDLLGLGQNEELLQTSGQFDTSQLEIPSPGGQSLDPLAEISAPVPYQPSSDMDYLSQEFSSADPYSTYQHGDMLPIGVLRGNFFCQYGNGTCLQFFEDAEDLQLHFEHDHFAFTRIEPAYRLLCSACHQLSPIQNELCFGCGNRGPMEVWIYGNYLRTPSRPRYPPSRQDLQMHSTSSMSYYPSSYSAPTFDSQEDPGMDNGSFNGSHGNFNYQLDDTYAGSDMGSQGDYGFGGSFNSAGPGSQYQGNMFARAWQGMSQGAHSFQTHRRRKTRQYRYGRIILMTVILLFAITFGLTYDSIFSAIRMALPKTISTFRAHLPAIGFVSILASFTMYSSMRHIHQTGAQATHSATHWPKPRYNYQNIPSKYFQCHGHSAPDTYVFGGRLS